MYVQLEDINYLGRMALEKMALEYICPCRYYDLTDNIDSMSDSDLVDLINAGDFCEDCDDQEGELYQ